MACRGEPNQGPRQDGKLRAGSQIEPASDVFQGDVVSRFGASRIQLSRGLGIDDFLLTQFCEKRNSHLNLGVRKGIHEQLKAVAIAGHGL
jgi:hypothetical protein